MNKKNSTKNKIPFVGDMMQEFNGNSEVPEIRVWCHPKKEGDDFYYIFDTFENALLFIKAKHKEYLTEEVPLLAFRGWEINIYAMKDRKHKKHI